MTKKKKKRKKRENWDDYYYLAATSTSNTNNTTQYNTNNTTQHNTNNTIQTLACFQLPAWWRAQLRVRGRQRCLQQACVQTDLCDVLQPSAQGDEHHQHRGGLKEGHRGNLFLQKHGHDYHHQRVKIGNGGCQDDQNIHVGCSVLHGLVGLTVEIPSANKLST